MENWGSSINKIIKKNVNLKDFCTMKINALTKYLAIPETLTDLTNIIEFSIKNNLKIFILGNGSNVIFSKLTYNDTIFISLKNFNKIELRNNILICESGVLSSKLLNFCIKNNIGGFEFLAGIPGTLGGILKMNAGAFGKEIEQLVLEIECFDLKKFTQIILNKKQLKFEYRKLELPNNYIITKAKLRIQNKEKEIIKNEIKKILKKRKLKQPSEPSAGSIFKNSKQYIAGKIIDECGLKGFKIGNAKISEKHANFIINTGNATGPEVYNLIKYIEDKVEKEKQVKLEKEVIIV